MANKSKLKLVEKAKADEYLKANIEEAKTDHNKACELYRNYVGVVETKEERLRRINAFRCG